MTIKDWEAHVDSILRQVERDLPLKYEKGWKEHGENNLWKEPVLPHILEEVQDLVVYVYTLKLQLEEVAFLLSSGLSGETDEHEALRRALSILTVDRNR